MATRFLLRLAFSRGLRYNTDVIAAVAEDTTMPVLELTDEQVIELIRQLPEEQKKRALTILAQEAPPCPEKVRRPRFGSCKNHILHMAEDFDAPLEDFKAYM
jgi:hypothetical protein